MRHALVLALGALVGCGRSIRHEGDGGDVDSGGGTSGARGGSGGVSGAGGATTGGATTGGATTGGMGGEPNSATRLFFESAGALVSTDFDGGDLLELWPGSGEKTNYRLVGVDGPWIIAFREPSTSTGLPSDASLLRVAADASEFATVFNGVDFSPLAPIVDGRVVLVVPPARATLELPAPEEPERIVVPNTGLASVRTDGTGFTVLAPTGVSAVHVVGERVLYSYAESAESDLYTSLADGSERAPLVNLPGSKWVGFVSGTRVIVNVNGDVVSVDADGGRLVELATGAEQEYAAGIAFDHVLISRQAGGGTGQSDLYAVPIDGGELVPLATGPRSEAFAGAGDDRIVFHVDYGDIHSVRLDGTDPVPVATSAQREYVLGVGADRVLFEGFSGTEPNTGTPLASATLEGADTVLLAMNIGKLDAIIDDRAIVAMGATTDIFSIPVRGGEPLALAENREPDFVVGRLGRALILMRGGESQPGALTRIDADGSNLTALLPSGRYVGAITEGCGVVPSNTQVPCENP